MVDLPIAANFARELTEEQFAEQRVQRRRTAAKGTADGSASAPREPRRPAGSRVRRTLARLAQARG